MNRHTPGPWVRGETADREQCVRADKTTVAIVFDCRVGLAAAEANARLIAAAPDMLAALEEVIGWAIKIPDGTRKRVCTAIAKAKGE